jgi:hypothetical protein
MYPTRVHAPGFMEWMPWARHTLVALTLLLPAGAVWAWRRSPGMTLLLLTQTLLLVLTFVGFNADHRHLYSIAFVLFLFGAAGVVAIWQADWIPRLLYTLRAGAVLVICSLLFGQKGYWSLYQPRPLTVPAAALAAPLPDGSLWTALASFRFWAPLTIVLPEVSHAREVRLSLNANDIYVLGFQHGSQSLGRVELTLIGEPQKDIMVQRRVVIPPHIATPGFDRLTLTAKGDGRYAVAALQLQDQPTSPATDGAR